MTAEAITTAAPTTTTARSRAEKGHIMKEFDRIITTTDGHRIRRVSRWLRVQYATVTPRHRLAEYADEGVLLFFRWQGRQYAIGQFYRLGGGLAAPVMWYDEEGKLCHLSGVDCENWHNPAMLEVDDGGEYVRVYESVE